MDRDIKEMLELSEYFHINPLKEIVEWWRKKDKDTQEIAADCIRQLNKYGHSPLWVYLAITKADSKDGGIKQWKGLLFNNEYREEITELEQKIIYYREERKIQNADIVEWMEEWNNREVVITPSSKKEKKLKIKLEDVEAYM